MNNMKHKISAFALLSSLAILTMVSCKRDIEDLEPAAFPTTPEVFI